MPVLKITVKLLLNFFLPLLVEASKLEMTVQISTEVDINSGGIENFRTNITKSLCKDFLWYTVR